MPTYVYLCSSCKKKHEIVQKITADALTLCPSCGKETLARTVPDSVAIQFKGSGFYINDYAQNKASSAPPDVKKDCGKSDCGCKS